ncbi:cell division protein FtsA [Nostoc sp. NIES-2111]
MAKVYNPLGTAGQQTEHWQARPNLITQAEIDAINTGDNDVLRTDPTSLPTPFARIDLFDTAFKKAAADLENETSSQKLDTWYNLKTSHALDLAQLLFEYNKYGEHLKIVAWNRSAEIEEMLASPVAQVRAFGTVLQLYLNQDAASYGFDLADTFYIFYWDVPEQVIGGTSPATLLFTAGNDLRRIVGRTHLNGRPLFDDTYQPLHERPFEFQLYLHELGKRLVRHASFRPLEMLLEASKKALQIANRTDRLRLDTELETRRTYTPIHVSSATLHFCGVEIGQLGPKAITPASTSMLLAPTKPIAGRSPMVMPNWDRTGHRYPDGAGYDMGHYEEAEAQASVAVELRRLPRENSQHPFLIANDLLADDLLLYPYQPNADAFLLVPESLHDFNRHETGYLLPLTPKFFEYFTAQDLIDGTLSPAANADKPRLELKYEMQGDKAFRAVQVILTLPGAGGRTLSVTRTYFAGSGSVNLSDGSIRSGEFNTAIFPFVRKAGRYRVAAVAKDISQDFSLSLLDSTQEGPGADRSDTRARARDFGSGSRTVYHAVAGNLDAVQVRYNGATGFLVPRLKMPEQANREIHFSIDFGTSNTHIEYKVKGQADAKPLAYRAGDGFVEDMIAETGEKGSATGRARDSILRDQFWFEFLPSSTSDQSPFHFPRRTALYRGQDSPHPVSLRDVNFALGYSLVKHNIPSDAFVTNLKWGNEQDAIYQGQVKAFIDELALLVWAKALTEGANLSTCQVVWFYPISMNRFKRNGFHTMWKQSLNPLFHFANLDKQATPVSESYAPYMFYREKGQVLYANGASVLVDIGGGTSDVLYFKENVLMYQGSLRYAGSHVFGNGFNTDGAQNGYYLAMRKAIEQHEEAVPIIDQSLQGNDSDMGSLLFALKNSGFDFATELKERSPELKCVPLAFFLTLIYHVAQIGKSLGAPPPRYLLFSGNGSRILQILVTSPEAKSNNALLELAQKVIEYVYGAPLPHMLEIRLDKEPKVLTAKGGIELLGAKTEAPETPEGVSLGGRVSTEEQVSLKQAEDNLDSLVATVRDAVAAMRYAMTNPALFEGLEVSKPAWEKTLNYLHSHAEDMLRQGLLERRQQGQDMLTEDPWVLGLAGQLGILARELQTFDPA